MVGNSTAVLVLVTGLVVGAVVLVVVVVPCISASLPLIDFLFWKLQRLLELFAIRTLESSEVQDCRYFKLEITRMIAQKGHLWQLWMKYTSTTSQAHLTGLS